MHEKFQILNGSNGQVEVSGLLNAWDFVNNN